MTTTAMTTTATAVTIPAGALLALADHAAAFVADDHELRAHVATALVALAVQAPDDLAAHLTTAADLDLEDLVAEAVTEALR